MVDLGPFFPDGMTLTWETDNPLAYFNLGAFVLGLLLLAKLRDRRGASSLVDGTWYAGLVITMGSGLHFLGDVLGVSEAWDHQFIHLVVLVATLVLFLFARRGD
ncbi:MAG TPA: hypothetical protein VM286_03955 [Candidatus Thermoplasmatota archaeon]|nr:hypothetical protein [Candidatus Thermoplasmatota archaeon]